MAAVPSTLPATDLSAPGPSAGQYPAHPKSLLLQQCRTMRGLRQLHAHLITTGLQHHHSTAESLLESAALLVPGGLGYAVDVFDRMPRRNTAAYNVMIRGFISKGSPEKALLLFRRMGEDSVEPDEYTFSCTLKACSRTSGVKEGEQIHAGVAKAGFLSRGFVQNTLIHMYASCGRADIARKMFDRMQERDIFTWNSMFAGYSKNGQWEEVVQLFREMIKSRDLFDEVALISVLTACGRIGDLALGEWIDGYVKEKGLKGNVNLVTSLIDMYAKCGQIDKARELFDEMPRRDVVAWSAMISGYSQSSQCREALELFSLMQLANVEPNEVTMVSVITSCAVLGALETGKWVHSFIKRKKMKLTVGLGTALIDFYAKCGDINSALEVFKKMPYKNVMSWTVLIQGLATNGQGREALNFFSLMLEASVEPNDVTFISVLSACSHAGLINEGKHYFKSMNRDYGIVPRIDHYGCMADMLGRAGLLDEAFDFIKKIPIEHNTILWRTLLASCRVHKNVKIGEETLNEIIKLEPPHSGDYVLLSNIYASVGRWDDALRVRSQMKEKGIKKTPGCSLIELEGITYEFFAENTEHPQSKEIYDKV